MINSSAYDHRVSHIENKFRGMEVDRTQTDDATFRAVDRSDDQFFIKADLIGGILAFNVKTVNLTTKQRSALRATGFFEAALDWFEETNIREIESLWLNIPDFTTNLEAFKKAYDPAKENREDAVKATPSWKIVSKFGFTDIMTVIIFDSPTNITTVQVIYSK